ncbi:Uncharacterised protein [Mycobacteroides abscessus subsp. abscessus]|nr:Uncharacterised protein [Mycobacteroides abscessus subsp. abscessus]
MPTPIVVTYYRANGSIDRIADSTAEAFANMVKRCGYKAASMFTWSDDNGAMVTTVAGDYAQHMAACNRHIFTSLLVADKHKYLQLAIERCRRALAVARTAEQQDYARSVWSGISTDADKGE